ncbi:MAG TPA: glycosyltransferase family 4 protein [Micromonosporaceae bacterium]|nr:glycosyltransferase family 4 protein [Micromonosporaceae bacterium]
MLVDNGVRGDSRVQKTAVSAAEAGWEVILLGRALKGQPETWKLGEAEVRLIPVTNGLGRRRHEFRRVFRRGLLAYPPNGIAAHRAQWVKAWKADLKVRQAALTLAEKEGAVRGLGVKKLMLRGRMIAATLLGRWVSFRYWQLTSAQRARKPLSGPIDRLYTWFWLKVMGDRAWRRLEPRLYDFDLAFGPVIDSLKPDIIHSHDFRMIGISARATLRARAAGRAVKLIWDAHEYLPGLNPGNNPVRWLPAITAYEREHAPYADAVVTVSEALADLLQKEHKLPERPLVVLNAPITAQTDKPEDLVPDVRTQCGLGPDVPLVAYCGGVAPVRGVNVMIEALPQLPDVHVALVSLPPGRPTTRFIEELRSLADQLGVTDRVHILPYAPHEQVARVLSTADAAVSPLIHLPNHQIALSNKFFEYSHARLPIVVSDVRTMAETVRSTGQGEVFRAQDVNDYIRAVRAVLADPKKYRAAYDQPGLLERWTWEAQAEVLDKLYQRLLADLPGRTTAGARGSEEPVETSNALV